MNLKTYFNQFNDFDIRHNHDARYVDQKCTPDIVCFIADCICNTKCANKMFSINDLWDESYFVQNCKVIFGKPSPSNPNARNEYNKVLSQPLKLLAYSHILDCSVDGNVLLFKVRDEDLLEYISIKERNAFNFMYAFFAAVINASGLQRLFVEYMDSYETDPVLAKKTIYMKYHRFISANTPSQSKIDCDRMFHKVFNLFAYLNMVPGSRGKVPEWFDLMYNKVNWRDKDKKKNLTRDESKRTEVKECNELFYIDYQVNKAIRLIKKMHGTESEIHDELSSGNATEVHHIFPKAKYPQLASYLENLILLTSSQHRQKAHKNSDFKTADSDYQQVCLLAKSRTVEKYIEKHGEIRYTKKAFAYVVNEGLEANVIDAETSFKDIRKAIIAEYNKTPIYLNAAEKKVKYFA